MNNWEAIRNNARGLSFDFYKKPMTIQFSGESAIEVQAVLDTTQSEETEKNTDGSHVIKATLFVMGADIGNAKPLIEQHVKINGEDYIVKYTDDTTDLYEVKLEAGQTNGY